VTLYFVIKTQTKQVRINISVKIHRRQWDLTNGCVTTAVFVRAEIICYTICAVAVKAFNARTDELYSIQQANLSDRYFCIALYTIRSDSILQEILGL